MTQDTHAGTQPAGSQDNIEAAITRLRQGGMRSTPARRLLLAALHAQPGHRTAEELAADVQAAAPDIHLTTIYRNLDELERLYIIDRTCFGHGPATYHLALAAHGHLICEHCATMTEIPADAYSTAPPSNETCKHRDDRRPLGCRLTPPQASTPQGPGDSSRGSVESRCAGRTSRRRLRPRRSAGAGLA